MPDIAIVVRVLYPVQNLLYRIKLIRAKHHQALVALMQYNIFSYNFTERTLL